MAGSPARRETSLSAGIGCRFQSWSLIKVSGIAEDSQLFFWKIINLLRKIADSRAIVTKKIYTKPLNLFWSFDKHRYSTVCTILKRKTNRWISAAISSKEAAKAWRACSRSEPNWSETQTPDRHCGGWSTERARRLLPLWGAIGEGWLIIGGNRRNDWVL